MEGLDPSSFRYQVLDASRRFKTNWVELAKYLYIIKKDKLYKEWGYIGLDNYCTKEIGIKKQTAFKLLSSYYFLTREDPEFLEEEILQKKDPKTLPGYEAINILRRAKGNKGLTQEDYNHLKEEVLGKAIEPREVGKQYRSMLSLVKNIDPEEEKKIRRITTIKRLIGTLKTLRKEVEILKLLPDKFTKQIDSIISNLELKIK